MSSNVILLNRKTQKSVKWIWWKYFQDKNEYEDDGAYEYEYVEGKMNMIFTNSILLYSEDEWKLPHMKSYQIPAQAGNSKCPNWPNQPTEASKITTYLLVCVCAYQCL